MYRVILLCVLYVFVYTAGQDLGPVPPARTDCANKTEILKPLVVLLRTVSTLIGAKDSEAKSEVLAHIKLHIDSIPDDVSYDNAFSNIKQLSDHIEDSLNQDKDNPQKALLRENEEEQLKAHARQGFAAPPYPEQLYASQVSQPSPVTPYNNVYQQDLVSCSNLYKKLNELLYLAVNKPCNNQPLNGYPSPTAVVDTVQYNQNVPTQVPSDQPVPSTELSPELTTDNTKSMTPEAVSILNTLPVFNQYVPQVPQVPQLQVPQVPVQYLQVPDQSANYAPKQIPTVDFSKQYLVPPQLQYPPPMIYNLQPVQPVQPPLPLLNTVKTVQTVYPSVPSYLPVPFNPFNTDRNEQNPAEVVQPNIAVTRTLIQSVHQPAISRGVIQTPDSKETARTNPYNTYLPNDQTVYNPYASQAIPNNILENRLTKLTPEYLPEQEINVPAKNLYIETQSQRVVPLRNIDVQVSVKPPSTPYSNLLQNYQQTQKFRVQQIPQNPLLQDYKLTSAQPLLLPSNQQQQYQPNQLSPDQNLVNLIKQQTVKYQNPVQYPQYNQYYPQQDNKQVPYNQKVEYLQKILEQKSRANQVQAPTGYQYVAQNAYPSLSSQQTVKSTDLPWAGVLNQYKSNTGADTSGMIELTYLLNHPVPVTVTQPYLLVKYKLPLDTFKNNLRTMLLERPELRGNPSQLYKELATKWNVTNTHPNPVGSNMRGEEINRLIARQGSLVKAKLVSKENEIDQQIQKIQNLNSKLGQNFNLKTNVVRQGLNVATQGLNVASQGFNVVTPGFNVVTPGLNVATQVQGFNVAAPKNVITESRVVKTVSSVNGFVKPDGASANLGVLSINHRDHRKKKDVSSADLKPELPEKELKPEFPDKGKFGANIAP